MAVRRVLVAMAALSSGFDSHRSAVVLMTTIMMMVMIMVMVLTLMMTRDAMIRTW